VARFRRQIGDTLEAKLEPTFASPSVLFAPRKLVGGDKAGLQDLRDEFQNDRSGG
jgi:hypothetical protein